MERIFRFAVIIFILGILIDNGTTVYAFQKFGNSMLDYNENLPFYEHNPLVKQDYVDYGLIGVMIPRSYALHIIKFFAIGIITGRGVFFLFRFKHPLIMSVWLFLLLIGFLKLLVGTINLIGLLLL